MGASLSLAIKFLNEGKKYVELNDPVQASEKLYKASEEAVKALASVAARDVYEEALKRGKWTVKLLYDAVSELSMKVYVNILHWWDDAWVLHVEGFHEARLTIDHVKDRLKSIDKLIETSMKVIKSNYSIKQMY